MWGPKIPLRMALPPPADGYMWSYSVRFSSSVRVDVRVRIRVVVMVTVRVR